MGGNALVTGEVALTALGLLATGRAAAWIAHWPAWDPNGRRPHREMVPLGLRLRVAGLVGPALSGGIGRWSVAKA